MRLIQFHKVPSSVRLFIADNFVDIEEIEYLLSIANGVVQDPGKKSTVKHDGTGLSFEMALEGNPVLNAISARIEAAFGFTNSCKHFMRFRRYLPGESHPLHYDNFEIAGNYLVATAMMWLSHTERGGETCFPYSIPGPVVLEARRGRLAVWLNYLADGGIDRSAIHEALPVWLGQKITLTNFVYAPISSIPAFTAGLKGENGLSSVYIQRSRA